MRAAKLVHIDRRASVHASRIASTNRLVSIYVKSICAIVYVYVYIYIYIYMLDEYVVYIVPARAHAHTKAIQL